MRQRTLEDAGEPLNGEEFVESAAFYRLRNTDEAPGYVMYFMTDRLCLLVLGCKLYSKGDEWSKLFQYVRKDYQLQQLFQNLPDSVPAVFKVAKPSLLQPGVLELENTEMPVNQPNQKAPSVTHVYPYCSFLLTDKE